MRITAIKLTEERLMQRACQLRQQVWLGDLLYFLTCEVETWMITAGKQMSHTATIQIQHGFNKNLG